MSRSGNGLLNYTTTIDPLKTAGEIQTILAKHGAKAIMTEYSPSGKITGLSFLVTTPTGERGIKLPVKIEAVLQILKNQSRSGKIPAKYNNEDQANRVAWRILKDWIEAQMAILDTEMVKIDQVFLPFMTNREGKTVYEIYQTNSNLLLESGE